MVYSVTLIDTSLIDTKYTETKKARSPPHKVKSTKPQPKIYAWECILGLM